MTRPYNRGMRAAISFVLAVISIALALPALALIFASEKIGDWSDEWCD